MLKISLDQESDKTLSVCRSLHVATWDALVSLSQESLVYLSCRARHAVRKHSKAVKAKLMLRTTMVLRSSPVLLRENSPNLKMRSELWKFKDTLVFYFGCLTFNLDHFSAFAYFANTDWSTLHSWMRSKPYSLIVRIYITVILKTGSLFFRIGKTKNVQKFVWCVIE